jgi:hypothetical protein
MPFRAAYSFGVIQSGPGLQSAAIMRVDGNAASQSDQSISGSLVNRFFAIGASKAH